MPSRKIPARKHRGVRDPIKQAQERFERIKNTIDNPPSEKDEQKVSNKVKRFMALKDSVKRGKVIKKANYGIEDKPRNLGQGKQRLTKRIPNFKQLPNESDRNYMQRINRTTNEAMVEARYEAKYGVDVVHDKKTGKVSVKKRPDAITKNKPKEVFQLTKEQKDLIKEQLRKKNTVEKEKHPEYQHDVFKFGEVVHGPPNITTIPRLARKFETYSKPGERELHLTSFMKKENDAQTTEKTSSKESSTVIDRKGKRKDLPLGTRAMLERERQNTVEMYRMIKKNKYEIKQGNK